MQQREHGGIMVDGRQMTSTLQCCHCQRHQDRKLMEGFCTKCMGPTCNIAECHVCLPAEKWLDQMEKRGYTSVRGLVNGALR